MPDERRRTLVDRPPRPQGEYVLYWMTGARRLGWNYALDRAVALAVEHRRPLVILEALRVSYPWASRRLHSFVLQGMEDNARRARATPALYYPYVEPDAGEGSGLLAALARGAVAVVTDDVPFFFYPRMLAAAARQTDARLEAVDSNGLLPVRAGGRLHQTAYGFRRHLQRHLKRHLLQPPDASPLDRLDAPRLPALPEAIERRWPPASSAQLKATAASLAALPIDDSVAPVSTTRGGANAAEAGLESFLDGKLARYADERNHPDADAGSGLSAHLHFGHLSPHRILNELARRQGWEVETLPEGGSGARRGWWGMSAPAEAFLDQLVTWRELGLNFCSERPDDYDRFDSLPPWALATLSAHENDSRPAIYSFDRLSAAATDDALWNAAQRQLVGEGRVHNYLRMLWGKRVIEWNERPADALATLVELNNRWALDGRDANSISGIFWCFGRYDRPWGPERRIFGVVRYMSSANTRRKLRLDDYLRRWGGEGASGARQDS